jgi:hypothetical protein
MNRILFVFLIFALAGPPRPGFAWEGAEILESTGSLRQEAYAAPSPTPRYCYWDAEAAAGPTFHATNADGYGNFGCLDPWLVHCDSDSLGYRGSWPLFDEPYALGSTYRVTLDCSVAFADPTRLVAARTVSVGLDHDEHGLNVGFPDGTTVALLAAGSGPDQAELVVPPGVYRITLTIEAYNARDDAGVIGPYEGAVSLVWEEDGVVGVEPRSWSGLKAAFR